MAKTKVDGWVVLDKPEGLTSTQAMVRVRRAFGAAKAGHAGTLDPFATGVLPVALGEATKTIPFIVDATKIYDFTLRWGFETTTCDLEGAPTETSTHRPSSGEILGALPAFTGRIEQVPPIFSAIHVDGRRAYELARAGEVPDLKAREVEVHEFTLKGLVDEDHAAFSVTCGKGTYIRALARDLARALGTRAHVTALRRMAVGPFRIGDARGLDSIGLAMKGDFDHIAPADQGLHPVQTALDDIPALAVTGSEAARLAQGLPITPGGRATSLSLGTAKAMGPSGLVALVQFDGVTARPIRVFNLKS